MLETLIQRKLAHVLFDEAHGEAWTIRPDVARTMQASHPQDSSYAEAAAALRSRDFTVAAHDAGPLDELALAGVSVLVIAHPSEPTWERTVGGSPRFSESELRAIEEFVRAGGGLVVLGETEQSKYGSNLDDLVGRFGISLQTTTVFDYVWNDANPTWIALERGETAATNAFHLVDRAYAYRAGTLTVDGGELVATTTEAADPAGAGLIAAVEHGAGRVVVAADSDLFGDDFFALHDHETLWLNLLYWVAAPAFEEDAAAAPSPLAALPAWPALRDATSALRLLQDPSGALAPGSSRVEAADLVDAMRVAVRALIPAVPHDRAYLEAVDSDLAAWVGSDFAVPDATASLAAFRPERHRIDGVEHVVVFPMYTPNGSQDRRYEALIVRVPWPDWLATLESTRYDNGKFVPVHLVDGTAGYDSECAVLFPETVTVAGRPTNNFGGIFCDREAARFRQTVRRASEIVHLQLPPDAEALVASEELVRDTYLLWDLVHDRFHSHGDLPFDPFIIRQRLPYWMYSLEELRVDLQTYVECAELGRRGFPFARYVTYAILFDRILRFPITGNRVRNYDGLGGQLLFAYLHRRGVVRWTDNALTIDWSAIDDAVRDLRDELGALYRSGIDTSRVTFWLNAHDLISQYVAPNLGSQWAASSRVRSDESDPKAWVDRVLDDEFPLSLFYGSLQAKMAAEPVPA
jgi:Family of unknown function (DUF6421)